MADVLDTGPREERDGGGVDFEAVTLVAEKASTHLRTAINRFGSNLKELIDTPQPSLTRPTRVTLSVV